MLANVNDTVTGDDRSIDRSQMILIRRLIHQSVLQHVKQNKQEMFSKLREFINACNNITLPQTIKNLNILLLPRGGSSVFK